MLPNLVRLVDPVRIAALCLASACVPSVPHFVTSAESRAGYPYEHADYGSAELLVKPQPLPAQSTRTSENGLVENAGYWHWNGLGYVWIEPSLEDSEPAYLWKWQK
jgi:hypothetical protein